MIRRSALTAMFLLVAACSVSEDQEVAIGRQNAEEINAQLPIVTDPAISGYIQALGESIAKKTSRSDLDWHFYVVNTKQVNAFALPGGFIYVNRATIESAENEAQLAGVLAHESGHVVMRHGTHQASEMVLAQAPLCQVCVTTVFKSPGAPSGSPAS